MIPRPRTLLAAVDLGRDTAKVLRVALAMTADRPGTALHVVTVVDNSTVLGAPLVVTSTAPPAEQERAFQQLKVATQSALRAFAEAHDQDQGITVEVHVALGQPVDEIVWLAAHLGADAIVVGTHGRRGVERVMLGSVAERVVRLAGCQVVVARDKHHDAPWRLAEVDPVCGRCAAARRESLGERLWCEEHQDRHDRERISLASEARRSER